jgi:hypothetical protein
VPFACRRLPSITKAGLKRRKTMFHRAHSALTWAYNVSACPVVKMPGINRMRKFKTENPEYRLVVRANLIERDRATGIETAQTQIRSH